MHCKETPSASEKKNLFSVDVVLAIPYTGMQVHGTTVACESFGSAYSTELAAATVRMTQT